MKIRTQVFGYQVQCFLLQANISVSWINECLNSHHLQMYMHLQLYRCGSWKQRFDDSSMKWDRVVVGGDAKPNIIQTIQHPTLEDKSIFLHCQNNIITAHKTKNYSWISSHAWSIFNSQIYPKCALQHLNCPSVLFGDVLTYWMVFW